MPRKHFTKKKIVKLLFTNGVHLWVILFVANIALFYSFSIFSQAAPKTEESENSLAKTSVTPSPSARPVTPTALATPTPAGAILDLSFTMPGIGSAGANPKPEHPTREVIVYLYPPKLNANDAKVKPQFTIQTQAVYDADPDSPTYTQYLVKNLDLGKEVVDGSYQIKVKTTQTLPVLIKEKEDDISGQVFELTKGRKLRKPIPVQSFIVGDIAPPQGNWVMDINDYNAFVSCFGNNQPQNLCPERQLADFDDNGEIDGTDYNLMVLSFKDLIRLGFPVPTIFMEPTPQKVSRLSDLKTTKAPSVTKTATPAATTKSSSFSPIFIILLLLFLPFVGGFLFLFFKNRKLLNEFHDRIFPKPQPTETPTTESGEQPASTEEAPSEQTPVTEITEEVPQSTATETPAEETPQAVTPEEPAAATDTSGETTAQPEQSTPTPAATTEIPATPSPAPVTDGTPQTGEAVARDYYVKKQADDDTKKGIWVTLTDENGPLLGFYTGENMHEGFAHVKGVMQQEATKSYLLISEITPTDAD